MLPLRQQFAQAEFRITLSPDKSGFAMWNPLSFAVMMNKIDKI